MDAAEQPRRHGGDWTEAYADEAFVAAVERLEGPTGASTGEVADAVGCERATALRRLEDLAHDGEVVKVNDRGRHRWFPGDARAAPAAE